MELQSRLADALVAPRERVDDLRPAYCLLAGPIAVAIALAALARLGGNSMRGSSDVVRAVVVLFWAMAGMAVGVRRRADRLGPIALGGALVGAGTMLANAVARHDGSAGATAFARVGLGVLPAVAFHVLGSLPDGRLGTSERRVLTVFGYGLGALVGLLSPHNGSSVSLWPLATVWLVCIGVGLALSHTRYRRANPFERRRMQWIGWAMAVWTESALVFVALHLMADHPRHLAPWALAATILLPLSLIAGTHGAMIARVDRLLTHTVSLAGLTALVIAFYLLVVLALGRSLKSGERSLLLLSMGAAALAAITYPPARKRLTDMTNQLVYGETVAPDEALRTFGSRLTRAIPLDELLLQMVESLRKSMNLTVAECWTGGNGRFHLAAAVPHREKQAITVGTDEIGVVSRAGVSGGTWLGVWLSNLVAADDRMCTRVAPIAHSGVLLGLIVVTRHRGDEFAPDDDRVLTELARQVGLTLHNAQLDSALQASLEELQETNVQLVESRRRIVTAGDAERRKLERNLHDGAQQYLVAMAVKLRLAEDLVEEEPSEALDIIGELRTNMQDAIAELRALAHGIFPPLLSSGGLTEALSAAAGRAALPTTFEGEGVGRYNPEVEASAYFCCMEALQNAGKHAGPGATAVVRVRQSDSVLTFEVIDTGAGFAMESRGAQGHGFVNMTDRLGAIGGTLTVMSRPGQGTTIRGDIPVAREVRQS
jgi:signal transduction histidine kinase